MDLGLSWETWLPKERADLTVYSWDLRTREELGWVACKNIY